MTLAQDSCMQSSESECRLAFENCVFSIQHLFDDLTSQSKSLGRSAVHFPSPVAAAPPAPRARAPLRNGAKKLYA